MYPHPGQSTARSWSTATPHRPTPRRLLTTGSPPSVLLSPTALTPLLPFPRPLPRSSTGGAVTQTSTSHPTTTSSSSTTLLSGRRPPGTARSRSCHGSGVSSEVFSRGSSLVLSVDDLAPGFARHVRTKKEPSQPIPLFREVLEVLLMPENMGVKLNVSLLCGGVWRGPRSVRSEPGLSRSTRHATKHPTARLQGGQRPGGVVPPGPQGAGKVRRVGNHARSEDRHRYLACR
jgi:hypothetical protein